MTVKKHLFFKTNLGTERISGFEQLKSGLSGADLVSSMVILFFLAAHPQVGFEEQVLPQLNLSTTQQCFF